MADGTLCWPFHKAPSGVRAGQPGFLAGEEVRSPVDATATPWQVTDTAVEHIVAARGRFLR